MNTKLIRVDFLYNNSKLKIKSLYFYGKLGHINYLWVEDLIKIDIFKEVLITVKFVLL